MTNRDVVQSYLEVLLEELLEIDEVVADPDGDIDVQTDEVFWCARVSTNDRPHIEVFSVVLHGVQTDPGLLEALNAVNRGLSHCRIFHVGEQVVVSGELVGETCALEDLRCLSSEVVQTARGQGPALERAFGGSTGGPGGSTEEGR